MIEDDASNETDDPTHWETLPTKPVPGTPKPAELTEAFPHLEVIGLLGQGGMGYVYKARQRGLNRLVALKLLQSGISDNPQFSERFAREAVAMAKLSHPGIVMVHDSGVVGGMYYFVMEYIDGLNLRELLGRSDGHLDPKEALRIVHSVCDALQYAHEEGVVHRDIKPENILLDTRGRVKIADFGLAKLLTTDPEDRPSNLTLSSPQQLLGTPHYMAPEQTERPLTVDHRADIYSVGVVFYEMLTGELPLGRFPLPSEMGRGDAALDEIVSRALQKDPDQRFQRASEIQSAVASALSGSGQPGSQIGGLSSGLPAPAPTATPAPAATPAPTATPAPIGFETYVDVAGVLRRMRLTAIILIVSAAAALVDLNPLGVLTILGAVMMRRLEHRGLAIAGAAAALIPYSVMPPLGIAAGCLALYLLFRADTKAAFAAAAAARAAARR